MTISKNTNIKKTHNAIACDKARNNNGKRKTNLPTIFESTTNILPPKLSLIERILSHNSKHPASTKNVKNKYLS